MYSENRAVVGRVRTKCSSIELYSSPIIFVFSVTNTHQMSSIKRLGFKKIVCNHTHMPGLMIHPKITGVLSLYTKR